MSSTTAHQPGAAGTPGAPGTPRASEQAGKRGNRAPNHSGRLLRLLLLAVHHIPTALVLAALALVGVGGHFYWHWRMPKFSALVGAAPTEKADWCEEHGVEEAKCVECNPALMPQQPDYGWCSEHGVSNCVLHHPELAQLKEAVEVTPEDLQRASRALSLQERKRNNSVCKTYRRRIQFASIEAVRQAGVDFDPVVREPISEWVAGHGKITYDPTRFASLASRAPGTVWRVEKNVGDRVAAGDVLALVDALEAGQAKTQLVQALADEKLRSRNIERLKGIPGVVAGRQVLEAEAEYAKASAAVLSAEQSLINLGLPVDADQLRDLSEQDVMRTLRFLGIPEPLTTGLDPQTTTANLLPVRAPIDGVIVDRRIVAGEVVDKSRVLFEVADTSWRWLILNVSLEDAGKLSPGQTVRFEPDGSRQEVEGRLSWISTSADPQTRMVRVRAELPNPAGQLRDETFGTGRVILREEPAAIVVPKEAVHWEGCCHVVFVQDKDYFDPQSPKLFHVRSVRVGATNWVRVGATNREFTEIIAGVLPGEVVATGGSDVLRAQLLKNNLGEGCTCAVE